MVSKIINYFFIPVVLFLLGLCLSLLSYLQVNNYFTLPQRHSTNYFVKPIEKKLYAKEKITGEFTATDNYLGTLSLYIETDKSTEHAYSNSIVFRFKEKGTKSWTQTNTYHKAQFFDENYFPFGFPVINDSLNKTYTFEIELLDTFDGYFIVRDNNNPLVSKYFFPKKETFTNSEKAGNYINKKILSSNRDPVVVADLIYSSILYFFPLLLYLFSSVLIVLFSQQRKKRVNENINKYQKILALAFVFVGISIDILFLHHFHEYAYAVLLTIWVSLIFARTINFQSSFLFSLLFLLFSFLLLQFNYEFAVEAMVWVYFFLIIGALHCMVSFFREPWQTKKII